MDNQNLLVLRVDATANNIRQINCNIAKVLQKENFSAQ